MSDEDQPPQLSNAEKIAARAAYEKEEAREAKRRARAESLVNPKRR